MKNEDENRVKTNVDNSANENGAHGRACVSLTADKSIQSDSQLDKYGSDKINGNIRGSVSDCVAACTKEVQKRCLKEKEKRHQTHGEKEQQGSGASKNFFCAVPVFLSECDGGKRSTASTCESGKGGDDCDNRKRDADTGQCQGTGPYKLESWDEGQSIVLVKNEDYYLGAPKIDKVIFKIVPDDNAQAMQLESGELDLALLDPKNAQNFKEKDGFTCYDMTTADYRGILFNFANDYWTKNRDIIPAVCYSIDRQAIIDSVLLGEGMAAYSPLQRNIYNNENVEHYDYNPEKAQEILEAAGCTRNSDGFYERDGEEIGFVISVMSGEQDRIDIAQAAAQQLRETGINCTVEIPAQMDWGGQMACLIGWGSPFDADDHTYKVFGTDKGANYSSYSNEKVDEYLSLARQSDDPEVRKEYYGKFQEELAEDPAYAFICYIDANYVADSGIQGISKDTVLGHHGVGIFWNIQDWTIEE